MNGAGAQGQHREQNATRRACRWGVQSDVGEFLLRSRRVVAEKLPSAENSSNSCAFGTVACAQLWFGAWVHLRTQTQGRHNYSQPDPFFKSLRLTNESGLWRASRWDVQSDVGELCFSNEAFIAEKQTSDTIQQIDARLAH